eukprot:jgi/Tetstr1/433936/TSEL_023113.t1
MSKATNSQHTLILPMFREFVTRMMMKSSDPGVHVGLCWENVNRLLDVADAKARTIPVAEEQLQDDIWTCGWRVLFFIYCLLKLEPKETVELISPSQALRARFIGNKQLQSGQPTPFKLDPSDAQKTLLKMAMECLVDMSSKQWNEMGFGIQGGRIQVKPYDGEKEGKVDPWKLWHWARSAPETWVGKKQSQMKRKALFAALLELRRAFVAGAEKAGELAPKFWSWPVIALLFTPADAPAQITYIDGQAPNLQAILACTCHCRPTEVYRGPEVSFTDAVKHIRYPGLEDHRLTERTLAETDPGAAHFITSHKNLMQPLEDLERGMGVPEENKPYMEQYHGYMFGSDTTHRGPAGAPVELPGGKPCPKCRGRGNVRFDEDYASIHARAKELRLVVEAAAPAPAAAASIPP